MQWFAYAPANIALIKYMGKKEQGSNVPDNASLSYTLNNLQTFVCLQPIDAEHDSWQALPSKTNTDFSLSINAQNRFLSHLAHIKKYFSYEGTFLVQSSNNFPHASGLASSASSFAALTKCAVTALSALTQKSIPSTEEQAQLSRMGSGSSCRSFFSPWALWEEEAVSGVALPYTELMHQVILIDDKEKQVSSSEAHKRVRTSPLYEERTNRAQQRLHLLMQALSNQEWEHTFEICWQEFHDMHELFHTSLQPFSYITDNSKQVLRSLKEFWQIHQDGPLVTMDAGPNIHLLYRPDQTVLKAQFQQEYLAGQYAVL